MLGFLKAVNEQLATFILALTRIFFDIRFFSAVWLVFILMFGDMVRKLEHLPEIWPYQTHPFFQFFPQFHVLYLNDADLSAILKIQANRHKIFANQVQSIPIFVCMP